MVTDTGGGPGGPGGARNVRNQRPTAASRIEIPASSINLLWVSGLRTAITASVTVTAKNAMPVRGTIANAIPSSFWPSDAATFRVLTVTSVPKIVIAVANEIPIKPTARCRVMRPEDASQVWKTKNKVHEENTRPW